MLGLSSVSEGSVLGLLFFLMYINALLQKLISVAKLFADDASLFSIVNCAKVSASVLNSDLLKIQDGAYQWKMPFNSSELKKRKRICFRERLVRLIIHLFTLTMHLLKSHIHRRT